MSEPGEKTRIKMQIRGSPYRGNAHAVEEVRRQFRNMADAWFVLNGSLSPALHFLTETMDEAMDLEGVGELGQEALLAALLHHQKQRPDVVRVFRRGEVLMRREGVDEDEGDALGTRRYLALLELVSGAGAQEDDVHWWLALRAGGTGEGNVGVFHGDWLEIEDWGYDCLPDEVKEWLDPGTASLDGVGRSEPQGPPPLELKMGMMTILAPIPDHPCAVAASLGEFLDREILNPPLAHFIAMAFRGDVLERWEIRGRLPVSIEDFLRAISAFGTLPDALAIIHPAAAEDEKGENHRAVVILVQRRNQMGRRVRPFRFEGGKFVWMDAYFHELGEAPEGEGWIGVPPTAEMNLSAVGIVGGGVIGEG